MIWRTWREQRRATVESHEDHRSHAHGEAARRIDTGHGVLVLEVFEQGVPPHWRIHAQSGHAWPAQAVETERPDGSLQGFIFADRGGYLESLEEIPEPHELLARARLSHGDHTHDYDAAFFEHDHGRDHLHEELRGLDVVAGGYQDAHELAHANDIRRRIADRNVTTGRIVMFGLTGGLISVRPP
jgi:nickel/cobalt exporter